MWYNSTMQRKPIVLDPSESEEQAALVKWANREAENIPELKLLFHIPNSGRRPKVESARLFREGLKPGVPDLFLPVASSGFHGLFIELKVKSGGVLSEKQKQWLEDLSKAGYMAVVCCGHEEAIKTITRYLTI